MPPAASSATGLHLSTTCRIIECMRRDAQQTRYDLLHPSSLNQLPCSVHTGCRDIATRDDPIVKFECLIDRRSELLRSLVPTDSVSVVFLPWSIHALRDAMSVAFSDVAHLRFRIDSVQHFRLRQAATLRCYIVRSSVLPSHVGPVVSIRRQTFQEGICTTTTHRTTTSVHEPDCLRTTLRLQAAFETLRPQRTTVPQPPVSSVRASTT